MQIPSARHFCQATSPLARPGRSTLLHSFGARVGLSTRVTRYLSSGATPNTTNLPLTEHTQEALSNPVTSSAVQERLAPRCSADDGLSRWTIALSKMAAAYGSVTWHEIQLPGTTVCVPSYPLGLKELGEVETAYTAVRRVEGNVISDMAIGILLSKAAVRTCICFMWPDCCATGGLAYRPETLLSSDTMVLHPLHFHHGTPGGSQVFADNAEAGLAKGVLHLILRVQVGSCGLQHEVQGSGHPYLQNGSLCFMAQLPAPCLLPHVVEEFCVGECRQCDLNHEAGTSPETADWAATKPSFNEIEDSTDPLIIQHQSQAGTCPGLGDSSLQTRPGQGEFDIPKKKKKNGWRCCMRLCFMIPPGAGSTTTVISSLAVAASSATIG